MFWALGLSQQMVHVVLHASNVKQIIPQFLSSFPCFFPVFIWVSILFCVPLCNAGILPGVEICATSGTTIRLPVKSHLSPAWACSTASALKITSTLKKKFTKFTSKFYSKTLNSCTKFFHIKWKKDTKNLSVKIAEKVCGISLGGDRY